MVVIERGVLTSVQQNPQHARLVIAAQNTVRRLRRLQLSTGRVGGSAGVQMLQRWISELEEALRA